jgi:hypothetical protein
MASQRRASKPRPPRHEQLNEGLVVKAKTGGEHKNRKDKRTTKKQFEKELTSELAGE